MANTQSPYAPKNYASDRHTFFLFVSGRSPFLENELNRILGIG
jgi:hypothetical protein